MELYKSFKNKVIIPSLRITKYILIIFILFILYATFVNAGTGYEYLNTSTIVYLTLDNQTFDSTGTNLHNFIDTGTVDTYGKLNRSRLWDTASDNLSMNNTATYLNYTVCFWVNETAQGIIWERYNSTEKTQTTLWTGTNKWNIYHTRRGVASDCTVAVGSTNDYYSVQVCIVHGDGADNFKLYINTSLVYWCNISSTSSSTATSDAFVFGSGSYNSYSTSFRGSIDEVSYFNKPLNQSEVNYLYNSYNPTEAQRYPYNYTLLDNTSITFISQSPDDITTLNAIGGINITYNYTINNFINTSTLLNWTIKNSTGNTIYSYLNGTQLPAYTLTNYSNNTNGFYRFFLDDNIYPATYNYNNTLIKNVAHYNYTLTTLNNMLKVQFINWTAKKYNIIEVDIATSSSSTFTDAYYCNSSYVSGLPLSSGFCAFIGSFNFSSTYNHCHNLSCHNIFTLGVVNNSFNNITVSNIGYVLVSGAGAGSVYVAYVNGSVRTNVSMSTTNRGLSWTNENFTIDAHIHFYNDNDYIEYFAFGSNSTNNYTSSLRTDAFNITNHAPSGVIVTLNNYNLHYEDTGLITRTNSIGFNANISYYKYVVFDNNFLLYDIINASTNSTSQYFYPINYTAGTYLIGVYAYDTNNQSSLSFSSSFTVTSNYIEPCNTTITLNSTGVSVFFNYTQNNKSDTVRIIGTYGIINYSLSNSTGYTTLYTLPNGNLDIYTNEAIDTLTSCTITFCTNTWTRQTKPCVDNLRLINYSYSCPIPYDNPYNNTGDYEDCTLSSNTDKNLWLIILLFVFYIVLLFIGLRYPFAMIGALIVSTFLTWQLLDYFTEFKTIIMFLFPVITIIFSVFSVMLNKK